MTDTQKYRTEYDYTIAILVSGETETIIGGTRKIVEKVIKSKKNPAPNTKGLDTFYAEKPLGTFAADIMQYPFEAEKLQPLIDKLYANLLSANTNSVKIAETRSSLDTIFRTNASYAIRILARVIYKWYDDVVDLYMNGKSFGNFSIGIALRQKDRADLGEQFRDDTAALIEKMFTSLKRKKSPRTAENGDVVLMYPSTDISSFLDEYSTCLAARKIYFMNCKNCRSFFVAKSCNTLYCDECKALGKRTSQATYAAKRENDPIHKRKHNIREHFERFIYGRTKLGKRVPDSEKAAYKKLYAEFMEHSRRMLKEHDKKPDDTQISVEINQYFSLKERQRNALEEKLEKKFMTRGE